MNPKRKASSLEAVPGDPGCSGAETVTGASRSATVSSAKERDDGD